MLSMSFLSIAPVAAQGSLLTSFEVTAFTKRATYFPTGVTFDGKNLWYSQPSTTTPGLFLTTTTGTLLQALSLVLPSGQGQGALAWDGTNLWVASDGFLKNFLSQPPFVSLVSTAGGGSVLKSLNLTSIFAPDKQCGVIDGLALDPRTGTLWVSPDIGCNSAFTSNVCSIGFAYQVDTSGNLIRRIQFPFAVSGVAVVGTSLYVVERCNGIIAQINPAGQVISSFHFTRLEPGSNNEWVESIAFDPTTFSTCAIWAMQPYFPPKFTLDAANLAAYAIPCP